MSACSFSILTLNLVLTHGIPPDVHGDVHIYLPAPHTIESVPSLSGHAFAYRWRSLPRVRWHSTSSPQGSSSNACCLCITMDQMLLCSSLFPHPELVYSVFFPFILGIMFVGRTSRGHTGFFIHILSAVRALIFLASRIQPFLSLVDREVEFYILCANDFIVLHPFGIFSFSFSFLVRKIPFAGIELTSQRVRRLQGYL